MNFNFGLDQIPSSFTDSLFTVSGPGVWLGEMSITGTVPTPTVVATNSYEFSF